MINIRKGKKEDLPQVLKLIHELAVFEKAPNEVENNVEKMLEDGFGEKPVFEFFVAETDTQIIGTAIYYYSYSTWKGRCLYLEDLVVSESFKRQGIGKLLFNQLISQAKKEKVARLSWQVLDWNEPAINFYKKLNADLDSEWINCKLTREQLEIKS
ncbi:GNAT family N-acetyltransferase [Xanthovirga aplysinae]|uniref:GNAT family N-acetyltransferase n=1 Tax=Xanthovirga aplysinae TaxID=2529853 RepID=UPI0012BD409B|nr:GNAT family N-acetyltransferase [Xanthovirga aplysinae]MTI30523.1 GNAT family N-acetyltransferase [Xanthovirga aplysinae]